MDSKQKERIAEEMKKLKGMAAWDYVAFALACGNVAQSNKSGKRHAMDHWLKANKLEVLKELSNRDLVEIAHTALGHYLDMPIECMDVHDEHFPY